MLHSLYSQIGLVWTLLVGIGLVLTAFTWMLAVAGVSSRPMSRGHRLSILAMLTAVPPSAIGYLIWAAVQTRREYGTGLSNR